MTHPPRGRRICGLTVCAGGNALFAHLAERFLKRDGKP